MAISTIENSVIFGGFLIGFFFGGLSQSSRFCILGAISDYYLFQRTERLKLYLLVLVTAILGTQILIFNDFINASDSYFLKRPQPFMSYIIGGLFFGFGMTLASGCTSRNLVKLGEGDLKALLVIITVGISSIATMKGIFSELRVNIPSIFHFNESKLDIISIIASLSTDNRLIIRALLIIICTCIISFFFLRLIFMNTFNKRLFFFGVCLGLTVVGGWYLTGVVGFISEHPDSLEAEYLNTNSRTLESLSFVGPIGYLLDLLMNWSDNSKFISFGITCVIGTIFGSWISAKKNDQILISSFCSAKDFLHHLLGGILMGTGGVVAIGCTVGHGLSGLSVLFIGSIIVCISIFIGSIVGLKYLEKERTNS